jgi:hypothetical protein
VQAAVCASRKRGSYLKDKFFRLKARRGFRRAWIAMAHKILVIVYHMLKSGRPYQDLGDAYLDRSPALAPNATWSSASSVSATTSACDQSLLDRTRSTRSRTTFMPG